MSEKTGTKHGTAFVLLSQEKTLPLRPSQWTLSDCFIGATSAALVCFDLTGVQSSSEIHITESSPPRRFVGKLSTCGLLHGPDMMENLESMVIRLRVPKDTLFDDLVVNKWHHRMLVPLENNKLRESRLAEGCKHAAKNELWLKDTDTSRQERQSQWTFSFSSLVIKMKFKFSFIFIPKFKNIELQF